MDNGAFAADPFVLCDEVGCFVVAAVVGEDVAMVETFQVFPCKSKKAGLAQSIQLHVVYMLSQTVMQIVTRNKIMIMFPMMFLLLKNF